MALHKFSKNKSFHVDYCGCTAAIALLNETSVRDAIHIVRQVKSKRDFIKTNVSTGKDGVRIVYDNEDKYSTNVPSTMIAVSAIGKTPFTDTVGKTIFDRL
jgi:hypothetical protein